MENTGGGTVPASAIVKTDHEAGFQNLTMPAPREGQARTAIPS
jgi:hypothetical protein